MNKLFSWHIKSEPPPIVELVVSNIRKPKSLGFFLSRNYDTSVHFIDLFVYPTWVVSCLKDQKCVQLRYKPFGKPYRSSNAVNRDQRFCFLECDGNLSIDCHCQRLSAVTHGTCVCSAMLCMKDVQQQEDSSEFPHYSYNMQRILCRAWNSFVRHSNSFVVSTCWREGLLHVTAHGKEENTKHKR